MPIRNPTDEETQRIIHASLITVFVFKNDPDDPDFLKETISWEDILSIPPVTKPFIRTSTLVATMKEIPGSHPTLAPNAFFQHLGDTKQETVKKYRDFLKTRLILRTN